jgi:hypothetical protein
MLRFLFLCISVLTFSSDIAFCKEKRLALLIGNKSYAPQVGTLKNPANDVGLLAQTLRTLGFEVKVVIDGTRSVMLKEINAYSVRLGSLGPRALGVFYYSGHGVSRPRYNTNFLIPVNVTNFSDEDFWWNAVGLDEIVSELKVNAPEASNFVIIDACRNELRIPSKAPLKGFSGMSDENGFFVALSTSPNTSASDEGEGGGPYAKALASELMQPGSDNLRIFQNVKRKVYIATSKAQRPWELNGLLDPVVFNTGQLQGPINPPEEKVAPPPEPAKTGMAMFEGVWRVVTIPTNTRTCNNPGRAMNIKIDVAGRVTDMCVWDTTAKSCGPSLRANIRRRSVGEKGAFELSYVVIPRADAPQHENRFRGALKENSGKGEVKAWRDGQPTACPSGRFTADRIEGQRASTDSRYEQVGEP